MRGDAGFPIRLRFAKRGPVRFLSHRDVARAFERAFRIAEAPLAFTRGYSPHPKVSFGPALAVGFESEAEYLDVELTEPYDCADLSASVTAGLPPGLVVTGAVELTDRAPSLQEAITALTYRLTFEGIDPLALAEASRAFRAHAEVRVPVTRKGASVLDDVRGPVLALEMPDPGRAVVVLDITTRPRTPRVADVVAGLRAVSSDAAALDQPRVVRTHQWIEREGARYEPLDVDRRSTAPTGAGPRALEACA